jgi:hypothetical protein
MGRNKDAVATQRTILRISHNADQFATTYMELVTMLRAGERIYATAGARDLAKAIRLFKERQIAADYDELPWQFYEHLQARWTSCLMDTRAQAQKVWLFDCDTPEETKLAEDEIALHYAPQGGSWSYTYKTKSGTHILVGPFDRSKLSERVRATLRENAIMLWAYASPNKEIPL